MPSYRKAAPKRRPKVHEQLALNVSDIKVRAYIEAVTEHLETVLRGNKLELQANYSELKKRIATLEEENAALRDAMAALADQVAALEGDGDDEYALTKSKLVKFMKHKGWL